MSNLESELVDIILRNIDQLPNQYIEKCFLIFKDEYNRRFENKYTPLVNYFLGLDCVNIAYTKDNMLFITTLSGATVRYELIEGNSITLGENAYKITKKDEEWQATKIK